MTITVVHLSKIILLLVGLSVHQSKSDSIRNGIIMNSANELEDSANIALADGSIDKNTVQQQSVDENNDDVTQHFSINSSIQQPQIGSDGSDQFDIYLSDFLTNHPGAEVVQPKDKTDNHYYEFRFTYSEMKMVEMVIHLLDINPFINYLIINSTSTELIKLTEHIEPPNVKKIRFKDIQEIVIYFDFTTSEWSRYHGFVITIQPLAYEFGNHPLEISQRDELNNESSKPTVCNGTKSNSLDKLTLLIEVPKAEQINETWHLFQIWLANSTNKYIDANDINVPNCSADNVTLNNIHQCQTAWPNSQNCVQMDFSLQLKALPNTSKTSAQSPQNNQHYNSPDIFQFNRSALIHIWLQFGRDEFTVNGFKEFPVPEAGKLLFLWSTVSLGVVAIFLIILTGIWKMEVLRDYRRMYWKNGDDEKQICKPSDMSMYPPVHQIVPTLFPNDVNTLNSTSNALPFDRPITFNVGDFNRRPSLEESLSPSANLKRKAGDVPFQSDSEFNDSKQDRWEDEMYFNNTSSI